MLFPQGWQISLDRPDASGSYADLTHGTERYVVGIPGRPFNVRFTAPKEIFWSAPIIEVNLTVEGEGIGLTKMLSKKHPSCIFQGFVNTVKGEHRTSQFLFGKPPADFDITTESAGTAGSQAATTGSLEVALWHTQEIGRHYDSPQHVVSGPAAPAKPMEGKKFFMRPSLKTESGGLVGQPITFSTLRYNRIRHLATLNLRMETASILVLRKVLSPANAAHKAIIDESMAAMRADLGEAAEEDAAETAEQAEAAAPRNPRNASATLGSGDIRGSGLASRGPGGGSSKKVAHGKRAGESNIMDTSSLPGAKLPKLEPGLRSADISGDAGAEVIELS